MRIRHDNTEISLEQRSESVDMEAIVRLQRELERINKEQIFLWGLKQQAVQHSIREQALFQEQRQMAAAIEIAMKRPTNGLYNATTFYKTVPYLDDKKILRHKKWNEEETAPGNVVHVCINGQDAVLYTKIDGEVQYIQLVEENGTAQLVQNPAWNKIKPNTDGSIAIQFKQGFLSAAKNGIFCFNENNLNCEHFWLQDNILPTLLNLESLIKSKDSDSVVPYTQPSISDSNVSGMLMKDMDSWFLFPWAAVRPGARIVIYSGGVVGKAYLRQLTRSVYCSLVAICDKNPRETGILEAPVIGVQELYDMAPSMYDVILIAVANKETAMEIREELALAGISMDKVKWADPMRESSEEFPKTRKRSPSLSVEGIKIQENNSEMLKKLHESEALVSELRKALNAEKKSHSKDIELIRKFSKYFTARADIKFISKNKQGDFQIISTSDSAAKIQKPLWWSNKNFIGYIIESYAGKIEIVVKATAAGQINLELKGLNVHSSEDESKNIPYYVDYTNLTINEKEILNKITPAWYNEPYRYKIDVKADEEIKIQFEWSPHKSNY